MIIKAKHHFLLDPFFRFYVTRKMKRSFNELQFSGDFEDKVKPVLLLCNHVSWWDGIWALWFNQSLLKRKFHFMMLEEQLRKNWFFKYTGGFSIRKKSKSIIETIDYTAGLLSDKKNVVLLFPAGKIQSLHKKEFEFEKGVGNILKKVKNEIQVIFLVNLIDYFSNPKPSLFCFFEDYSGEKSVEEMQIAYNLFCRKCLEYQAQKEE